MQKELEYFDQIQMLKRHNFWLVRDLKNVNSEIRNLGVTISSILSQINNHNHDLVKSKWNNINIQNLLIDLRTRIIDDIYNNGIEIRRLRLSNLKLTKDQIKQYNEMKEY